MRRAIAGLAVVAAGGFGVAGALGIAAAQSVDTKRPHTFVVGAPRADAPMERSDAARTGRARARLPSKSLRVEWKRALLTSLEFEPLVDAEGGVLVVASHGDVIRLRPDGSEEWRVITSALQGGPATLTADGTLVFVAASGEAIGVRRAAVRFRTRVARVEVSAPDVAPLALDDGGSVVATRRELFALDGDGGVRTQATVPEPIAAPLVVAGGKIIAVGESGTVYGWTPGGEASRIGSFGAPVDGAAALADDHTLVAVTAQGANLVALDLTHGVAATRASPPAGVFLGAPAVSRGVAYVFGMTTTKTTLFALDGAGKSAWIANVATNPVVLSPDGGATPLVVPPHVGPIVDSAGVVAFGAPGGAIGVAAGATGSVEVVGDTICAEHGAGERAFRTVAGVASAGAGAFVVSCASGTVVKVSGQVEDAADLAGDAGSDAQVAGEGGATSL